MFRSYEDWGGAPPGFQPPSPGQGGHAPSEGEEGHQLYSDQFKASLLRKVQDVDRREGGRGGGGT